MCRIRNVPRWIALAVCLAFTATLLSCADNNGSNGGEAAQTQSSHTCNLVPASVVSLLQSGITASGQSSLTNISYVDNNDGRPWKFIGAQLHAGGVDGEVLLWATASPLAEGALILAVNTMAAEFSIWQKSGAGEFASMFDDDIAALKRCVG